MRDRDTIGYSNNEPPLLLDDFHPRAVVKLARISQRSLHEHDGDIRGQPVDGSNFILFLDDRTPPGSMRYQDGKFQMLKRVPQESAVIIGEFKSNQPQLRAAHGAR